LNLVATVMRRDPEVLGLSPDGAAWSAATAAPATPEIQWPLRLAIRTGAFWLIFGVFTATWIPVFIPLVHIVPFARDFGMSSLVASTVLSALGIAAVVGRLAMGAVSDRIGRRPALALVIALQTAAFLGFTRVHGLPSLYLVALGFGFSYGAVSTLFPAIVGDFFGREQAGSLVGFLFALAGSMAAWGPLVAGAIYDATGAYTRAFLLSAVSNGVALVLLAFARPPRAPR
ncbi:MAG: MFS transporter, partial [Candidatus Rokuibacteriota bacterium]